MAKDVKTMHKDLLAGMAAVGKERGEVAGAFSKFMHAAENNGPLDPKIKELIGVAISVYCRCEYCIVFHVNGAFQKGATREEILDAALTAMVYGGGPTMAYISATLMPCLDEFDPNKEKE